MVLPLPSPRGIDTSGRHVAGKCVLGVAVVAAAAPLSAMLVHRSRAVRGFDYFYKPWTAAMTAAHVRAEPAINTTSILIADLCGFAIAIPHGQTQAGGIFPLNVS